MSIPNGGRRPRQHRRKTPVLLKESRMPCALVAFICVALVGCNAALVERRSDLELTWEKAVAVWPGYRGLAPTVARMESRSFIKWREVQRAGGSWPVVLYMHGCTGIGSFDFLRELAHRGFVVVAPDSMARGYRPLQCDPNSLTGGYNLFVYDFRQAEISYAVQKLLAMPWVDQRRIFLIGVSEGGVAAALYRGDEFRARVVAQWTCTGRSVVRGIDGPRDSPVLSIVGSSDPWYDSKRAPGQSGNCGRFMADRPGSQSLLVSLPETHSVLFHRPSVDAILNFLDRVQR